MSEFLVGLLINKDGYLNPTPVSKSFGLQACFNGVLDTGSLTLPRGFQEMYGILKENNL